MFHSQIIAVPHNFIPRIFHSHMLSFPEFSIHLCFHSQIIRVPEYLISRLFHPQNISVLYYLFPNYLILWLNLSQNIPDYWNFMWSNSWLFQSHNFIRRIFLSYMLSSTDYSSPRTFNSHMLSSPSEHLNRPVQKHKMLLQVFPHACTKVPCAHESKSYLREISAHAKVSCAQAEASCAYVKAVCTRKYLVCMRK